MNAIEVNNIDQILIQIIEDFFKTYGIKYLHHERTDLWLIRYFNFRLKYIGLEKRRVLISKALCDKIILSSLQGVFDEIVYKATNGFDLNPYQSKKSFDSNFHDDLFNDWGIHHLHLNNTKKSPSDFFYDRSGPLLFVKFTDTTAYFIDIQHHNDKNVWSNRNLIRIIQDTWPDVLKIRETENRFYPDFNDEEISTLRKKGYVFGINVDDKSYMMLGDGYSSSGDNGVAVSMAGEVWRWIGKNKHIDNPDKFYTELKQRLMIE